MENDVDCYALPLVHVGRMYINKVLTADMKLLDNIKAMFLSRCYFDSKEVIRMTLKLSQWTKTPIFYSQLLYKSITMLEEYELSSFLIDQIENLGRESFMTITSMSILHVLALQRRPVLALAEKVVSLYPKSVSSRNTLGETPLHVALQSDSPSVELVIFLLRHDPKAATVLTNDGKLPIHMLFTRHKEYPCLSCLKLLLKVYPKGSLVKVDETFTNIFLVERDRDDEENEMEEEGEEGGGRSLAVEERNVESNTSRHHLTWTVLSRLDELARDHSASSCVCRGGGDEEDDDTDTFCAHHYYLQASMFAHRTLSHFGLDIKHSLSLRSVRPSSFSYSNYSCSFRSTTFTTNATNTGMGGSIGGVVSGGISCLGYWQHCATAENSDGQEQIEENDE